MIPILKVVLMIVEVFSGILLIGLILVQRSKSQGMGLAFGGAMGESLFGARAGNVLTRITVVLAVIFLVNTTLLSMMSRGGARSVVDSLPDAEPALPRQGGMNPGQPPVGSPQGDYGAVLPAMDPDAETVESVGMDMQEE